ncbi:catalase [Fusarium tjaetaba]|uniref:Catalase n=1 Tax=Fusarium tjaetaba TaxID=1567544 RepID=A0A8H5QYQ5_9HYPO|nr:catalase [Fusarium tjaetaba]KAF5623308.1 catalase [Fusarium tjaetaba]
MDDCWRQTMLSSRAFHNRKTRKFTAQASSSSTITRVIGSYQLQCPKAHSLARTSQVNRDPAKDEKHARQKRHPANSPRFEINRFTDEEDGLEGDLFLPDVLDASFIMAGSRKKIQEILDRAIIREDSDFEPESVAHSPGGRSADNSDADDRQHETCPDQQTSEVLGDGDEDEHPKDSHDDKTTAELRSDNFEKNTFRQPKFWLSWRGKVLVKPESGVAPEDHSPLGAIQSGVGYVVFTGNKYQKFKGTISCDVLGWDNVAITGWKQ